MRITTKIILSLLALAWTAQVYGQDFQAKKSIFLELGGQGGFGSLNYESIFAEGEKLDWYWRVGLSGFPIDKNTGFVFVVPATVGTLIGQDNHKLELGFGQGFSLTTKGAFWIRATAAIGYRYQFRNPRFYARLAYTPLISYLLDFQYQHWAGFAFGINLNSNP